LPPFWKTMAPAVAASGLPVIASQRRAWSGGLFVAARHNVPIAAAPAAASSPLKTRALAIPARDYVREKPLQALGIALAAGYLLHLLTSRD